MNDRLSAAWILVVGSVLVGFFYFRSRPMGKAKAQGGEASPTGAGTGAGTGRPDPSSNSRPSGPVKGTGQEYFPWPRRQFEKIDEDIRKGKIKPVPGFYNPKDLERLRMGYTPPFFDDEMILAWEVG